MEDDNIPPRHSESILQARPAHTEIWRVPGAGHCGAISVMPYEFGKRLLDFYQTHSVRLSN